jgi:RIP metalloprotease RseP
LPARVHALSEEHKYDFVVAKDGSGDFKTVQEAIDAVPHLRKNRTLIFIKNGVYKEKLLLPSTKTNVSLIGEDLYSTVLTFDDFASKKNIFGEEESTYLIGISPAGRTVIERKNPLAAAVSAVDKTWEISKLTVISVVKMLEGVLSPRTLGGPIFIAQVAGDQVKEGIIPFVLFMAILSINLGVVNLFPIPVLDGGHIFFYLIEMAARREIPVKIKEWAQQIGFVVLLMLMLFVIMIDIERLNIKPINNVLKFFK